MRNMVKRLIVKTDCAQKLLSADLMHQLGKLFLCHVSGAQYKAVYFSQSTNIFFEGSLKSQELKDLKSLQPVECKQIEIDDFHDEIRITI